MPVQFRAPKKKSIKGIVAVESDALVVELEKKPWFRTKRIITLEISLDEIDFVSFRKGMRGATMVVRTLYYESTEDFPWRDGIEVSFSFSRKEREGAEELVAQINEAIDRQERSRSR